MIRRIAACRYFEPEIRAALAAEGLAHLDLQVHQGSCDRAGTGAGQPLEPDTLRLGGTCSQVPGSAKDLDSCFALLLGQDLVDRFLDQGLHLLTPRMLEDWEARAGAWGFTAETARMFFGESTRGFRVVDCGVRPIAPAAVAGLSAFTGVPVDLWPASLEPLCLRLRLALAPPRPEQEPAADRRVSDLAMAFDLVGDLLARPAEAEVAQGILDLFSMLCAPEGVTLRLFPCGEDGPRTFSAPPDHRVRPGRESLLAGPGADTLVDRDAFLLALGGTAGPGGALLVEQVAFPERRSHYLNLGATLAPVLALILADLRRRDQVIAQEVAERSRSTLAHLAAIVESSADAILSTVQDGAIASWNDAATRMFGYAPAEALGRQVDFLIPDDLMQEEALNEARVRAGAKVDPFRTLRRRKDGSMFDASVTLSPLRDGHGRVIGTSRTTRDISGQMAAELRLRESEARHREFLLGQKEELEEQVRARTAELVEANHDLESFSYSVSHDLQAPLRAMSGYAKAILEDFQAELPAGALHYLQAIDAASGRMAGLINGILALSRWTRAELCLETVDLSGLAERLLGDLARSEPSRSAAVSVQPGLEARGDPRMLEAVLANLLGNAWKYTGATPGAAIRVYGEVLGGRRWTAVADNGAGFNMAHAAMLFKPFKRLHRVDEFPGLGIGLATVERIIRRHGGEIQASAAPGAGATFRFTLPDRATPPGPAPGSAPGGSCR